MVLRGQNGCVEVMQSNSQSDDPLCKLAHDLNNKIAVILGCCDLIGDGIDPGSECAKRLGIIRETARDMARDLRLRSCRPVTNEAISSGLWVGQSKR